MAARKKATKKPVTPRSTAPGSGRNNVSRGTKTRTKKTASKKSNTNKSPVRKKTVAKKAPTPRAPDAGSSQNQGFVILLDQEPKTPPKPSTKRDGKCDESSILLDDGPKTPPRQEVGETIPLGSTCTLKQTAQLYIRLSDSLETGGPVTLDIQHLEEIDSAGLQLLCVYARHARAQNVPTIWSAPSAQFKDAARDLGLSEYFDGNIP